MSLAERLATPASTPSRCGVHRVLAKLDDADRQALLAALANPDFTASAISTALRAEGHHLLGDSIRRHRRGVCSCVTV